VKVDLLDFADVIGPGGPGLKKDVDIEGDGDIGENLSDDDVDEDSDALGAEADLQEDSEEDSEEDHDDEEEEVDVNDEDSNSGEDGLEETEEESELQRPSLINAPTRPDTSESVGAPASRYIPPQLRAAQLTEKANGDKAKAEERIKLERKAQGLLNK
jgi:nucleolar MIF4G domain-containing protein 1